MRIAGSSSALTSLVVALAGIGAGDSFAMNPHAVELPRSATTDVQTVAGANGVADTSVLYSQNFDVGASCTTAGWTVVDLTAQTGVYFHIDDYVGLSGTFAPVQGAKSLWCGARSGVIACGYLALPGYGNNWDQAWCTKNALALSADGVLDVSFIARIDTDYGDIVTVEYTTDISGAVGWTNIDPSFTLAWSGPNHIVHVAESEWVGSGPVKVRVRFHSDDSYSDEDGMFDSSGAVHIDSLKAEGLPVEDFEGEAVNATSSNDWQSCTSPGYGNHLALFKGNTLLQGGCETNLSCVWAAINASTSNYACAGYPLQTAVPYANAASQYISNEIWSPTIPLSGSGSEVRLSFSVYRENAMGNLVFYTWRVRTVGGACPGPWRDEGFVYYGGNDWIADVSRPGDWFTHDESIGPFVDLGATGLQVALGVVDQCRTWCGIVGASGACHSHAPLLDHVRVTRINTCGPQWSVRDIDQFQDSFPEDGTITGIVRADAAVDIRPVADFLVQRGDSAVVTVFDPVAGLDDDLAIGGKAVYVYVRVAPAQPAKSGPALSGDVAKWPHAPAQDHDGWTALRMESIAGAPDGVFCVDLNDNLFTPGDTVSFYYGARSAGGCWSYASGTSLQLQTSDPDAALESCSEFTCLPASGYLRGGDILYVDGVDGRGGQQFFDQALEQINMYHLTDRFDIRGSSSTQNNSPTASVKDITQLTSCYRKVLWDGGDLSVTPNCLTKQSDYWDGGVLWEFLFALVRPGGVYICGDDVSDILHRCSDPGVHFLYQWIPHNLVSGNHRPLYGLNPMARHVPGGAFSDDFALFAGCPLINDFDVMQPTGWTVNEVTYGAPSSNNGAVISARKSNGVVDVGVVLAGFSFAYIRDDETDGISDRAKHLHDVLIWLSNFPDEPVTATPSLRDALDQNYPNPFNPRTTIAYSTQTRGPVSLRIYDVSGALVRTLVDDVVDGGSHVVQWDGLDGNGLQVASGVYFYLLSTPRFSDAKRMVVLK